MAFPTAAQPVNVEVNKFQPVLLSNQKVLCSMAPARFDAFVKVLGALDSSSSINVIKSEINQNINNGTAILQANVNDIINDLTLQILNPKKSLKLMKAIRGNNDVFIIDDEDNKRFIVTNGEIRAFLPKKIDDLTLDSSAPSFDQINMMGKILSIDKDIRSIIVNLIDSPHVDLLVYGDQIKAVHIPDTAVYTFSEFLSEKIDESNASMKLRCFSFLNIAGEKYQIALGEVAGKYWVGTIIDTGIATLTILENANIISDDNLLI